MWNDATTMDNQVVNALVSKTKSGMMNTHIIETTSFFNRTSTQPVSPNLSHFLRISPGWWLDEDVTNLFALHMVVVGRVIAKYPPCSNGLDGPFKSHNKNENGVYFNHCVGFQRGYFKCLARAKMVQEVPTQTGLCLCFCFCWLCELGCGIPVLG